MKKLNKKVVSQLIVDFINNLVVAKNCYGNDNEEFLMAIYKCNNIENLLFKHNQQNELYKILNENNIIYKRGILNEIS